MTLIYKKYILHPYFVALFCWRNEHF